MQFESGPSYARDYDYLHFCAYLDGQKDPPRRKVPASREPRRRLVRRARRGTDGRLRVGPLAGRPRRGVRSRVWTAVPDAASFSSFNEVATYGRLAPPPWAPPAATTVPARLEAKPRCGIAEPAGSFWLDERVG